MSYGIGLVVFCFNPGLDISLTEDLEEAINIAKYFRLVPASEAITNTLAPQAHQVQAASFLPFKAI